MSSLLVFCNLSLLPMQVNCEGFFHELRVCSARGGV